MTNNMNGCHHSCFNPHHHRCGRTKIMAAVEVKVTYIDYHGHTQHFNIVKGQTYEIDALSNTRGMCHLIGKIVDFGIRNTDDMKNAPHESPIDTIIFDCSDAYESTIYRINVENIDRIVPILDVTEIPDRCKDKYVIDDPFAKRNVEKYNSIDEDGQPIVL